MLRHFGCFSVGCVVDVCLSSMFFVVEEKFSICISKNVLLNQKKGDFAGTPHAPARGLRLPAPPAE